jgi:zinc transport system substrate-binding protein|uniref:Zinc ABC transporter substrate-binding protein n=1 Tax=Desulfobacca acetoxidans TaxID=60893 RepID=A0A7V6A267_9BACT
MKRCCGIRLVLLLAFILISLVGWTAAPGLAAGSPVADKIPVVASILPLGDFCQKIGGKYVDVSVLVPPGASPHAFEPSPTAVAKAAEARVFVYVGAGLDPWAERLLAAQKTPGQVVVKAVAGIPLLKDTDDHEHEEADAGVAKESEPQHHHEAGNPHVWLDPVLAEDICRRIAQALMQVDPAHKDAYEVNLAEYLGKLQTLNRDIKAVVATFRHKDYVTFHPAFAYFSQRYGLRQLGVIEASPGREPSPGHVQRIIAAIKKSGVKAVFAEPQLNSRVAEVIAQEAGVKVLILDPLGGRPPYGSDYIKLMRYNLAVLVQAMQ